MRRGPSGSGLPAPPPTTRPRGHVADCYLAIGERLTADKDFPAAIRPLESARAILEPIAAKHPDVSADEESLAECYKEMGIAQAGQGGASPTRPGVAQKGRDHPAETADRSIPRE